MLMTALFLVLPSCSKNDVNVTLTPSEEVVNAFQQKYPDVKNFKWEILVGAYEAEFIYSGTYSENGQHIILDKVEAQAYITQTLLSASSTAAMMALLEMVAFVAASTFVDCASIILPGTVS